MCKINANLVEYPLSFDTVLKMFLPRRLLKSPTYLLILTCCWFVNYPLIANNPKQFQLKPGDLLFQDLNCGALCDGIDSVTEGVLHTRMSHVGMVSKVEKSQVTIIEAIEPGVIETPLQTFLNRSLDAQGNPRVVVGRLSKQYTDLIPQAIQIATQSLGKPYNASFYPNHGESMYCSQLIVDAFLQANHQHPLFHSNKINFYKPGTTSIQPIWQAYYVKLNKPPPQGLVGSNPGLMSREKFINLVHWYGQLRHQN